MARRLASEHRISNFSKVYSSRPCIPQAAPGDSPSLESQASSISDLWSMSGCSPATSKSNGSSNSNSPTLGNQRPCPPTGTQGSRQFPGDASEFFKSLGNCWTTTTVNIVDSRGPNIINFRGPVGESSSRGSRGLLDVNFLERQPKPSLKVNVPAGDRGAFFRVLAVMEVLTKMGVRFANGTCKQEGLELSFEFEVENALNEPLSQEDVKSMEETARRGLRPPNMGEYHMMCKNRMPGLESMSKSERTAITVAGMDSLGVLCKISEKLHKGNYDIEATALRTQGLWPTGRFASVFYIKPIKGKTPTALERIKTELEYVREESNLEVTHDERLGTPELWLNWELSRHAYPKPDMELPKDVSIVFSSPEPSWPGWKMVLGCHDSPYVVFDILCTLYFRGYKVVQNSKFKVEGSETRMVYMECYLQLQDSHRFQESDKADIKGHLALAFYRRRTENSERFEVKATDAPGVLQKVSQLFHESWWTVTLADVEINGGTAKTIIYAMPGSAMSVKLETLKQAVSKLSRVENIPTRSKPIDIIR